MPDPTPDDRKTAAPLPGTWVVATRPDGSSYVGRVEYDWSEDGVGEVGVRGAQGLVAFHLPDDQFTVKGDDS